MEKMQMDILLGGSCELPHNVTLKNFLSARAPELIALNNAIEKAARDKPMYSKNPPTHMRRALMSHNRNQLPRRILEAIKRKNMEEPLPVKVKNINKTKKMQSQLDNI